MGYIHLKLKEKMKKTSGEGSRYLLSPFEF
jgi:hypothetical protein